jgi:hypothetical protein
MQLEILELSKSEKERHFGTEIKNNKKKGKK